MAVRDSTDPAAAGRRRQVLVRGTFGFIAGAIAGVATSLAWLDHWWVVVAATLVGGALCAYLAATRGDRFWEQFDWFGWP